MPVRKVFSFLLVGVFAAIAPCAPAPAQSASTSSSVASAPAKRAESVAGYNQPPKNILDVMLAPSLPQPEVSPTQDGILLLSWQEYPSISRVATPFLRLAGVRVEPKNHSKHDTPGGYGITPAEEVGKAYMQKIGAQTAANAMGCIVNESGYVRATVTSPKAGHPTLRFEYRSVKPKSSQPDDSCAIDLVSGLTVSA